MRELFWVFIGSGLGGMLRYLLALIIPVSQTKFPYSTIAANVFACLLFGFTSGFINLQSKEGEFFKLLVLTGFCGGLSTFSTFTNDVFLLKSSIIQVLLYATISLSVCYLSLLAGIYLAKLLQQ